MYYCYLGEIILLLNLDKSTIREVVFLSKIKMMFMAEIDDFHSGEYEPHKRYLF